MEKNSRSKHLDGMHWIESNARSQGAPGGGTCQQDGTVKTRGRLAVFLIILKSIPNSKLLLESLRQRAFRAAHNGVSQLRTAVLVRMPVQGAKEAS